MKKLLFIFLFYILLKDALCQNCFCFENQTVTNTVASISIGSPTTTGGFGGTSCAANCSTIITFVGDVYDGLPGGEKITILSCQNFSPSNVLTVFADKNIVQKFTSCPSASYSFTISHNYVYTFNWQLSTPVTAIMVTQPIQELPTTTTKPTIATFSPPVENVTIHSASDQIDIVLILDGSSSVSNSQNVDIKNILIRAFQSFQIDINHINIAIITSLGDDYPIILVNGLFNTINSIQSLQKYLDCAFDESIICPSDDNQSRCSGPGQTLTLSMAVSQLYNPNFLTSGYRNSTLGHLAIYVTTTNSPNQDAINEAQKVMQQNLFQFMAIGYQGVLNEASLTQFVGNKPNCVVVASNNEKIVFKIINVISNAMPETSVKYLTC